MICHWATNRTDPQNLLSMTLDVPLQNTRTNQENPNKRTRSNKTVGEKDKQSWEENRIVYINGKIYVPRNKQL